MHGYFSQEVSSTSFHSVTSERRQENITVFDTFYITGIPCKFKLNFVLRKWMTFDSFFVDTWCPWRGLKFAWLSSKAGRERSLYGTKISLAEGSFCLRLLKGSFLVYHAARTWKTFFVTKESTHSFEGKRKFVELGLPRFRGTKHSNEETNQDAS